MADGDTLWVLTQASTTRATVARLQSRRFKRWRLEDAEFDLGHIKPTAVL